MKTEDLQQLLDRYREGTIDAAGREELQRQTHRDEVMAAARRRADGIVRRRRTALFTLAGLLVAGAAIWTLLPQGEETPLVAEAAVPEATTTTAEPTVEQTAAEAPAVHAAPKPAPRRRIAKPAEEPVVICNNQCEADSVINDIWKFLTV